MRLHSHVVYLSMHTRIVRGRQSPFDVFVLDKVRYQPNSPTLYECKNKKVVFGAKVCNSLAAATITSCFLLCVLSPRCALAPPLIVVRRRQFGLAAVGKVLT